MRLRVLVMARTNNHIVAPKLNLQGNPKNDPEGGRWRRGEFVDAFEPSESAGPDGSPAFNRVYITDWPGTLEDFKDEFLNQHIASPPHANPGWLLARRGKVFAPTGQIDRQLQTQGFVEVTEAEFRAALDQRQANSRNLVRSGDPEPQAIRLR